MRLEKPPEQNLVSIEEKKIKSGDSKNNLVKKVYDKKTQLELASFLHATFFWPVKSTLIKDVNNGNFATWPGLTTELMDSHLPKPEATFLEIRIKQEKNLTNKKWAISTGDGNIFFSQKRGKK